MKKFLRYQFFILLLTLLGSNSLFAQCPVVAYIDKTSIFCGDSVTLSATNQGTSIYTNDFNAGLGGWSGTTAATTGQPCNPSQNGTNYLWMGASAGAPRSVTSNAFNLSTGGSICFDMKFATQGAASPCEGPDLPTEGVNFQYSTDGGATWVTIQYYDPNGGFDPNLTIWKTYCFAIPAGAMTASTKIRWYQGSASGAAYDNWGLDNVVIKVNNPAYQYTWQHTGISSASSYTPKVAPSVNTTYTVVYTDGVSNTCSASVSVTVTMPTTTASAATPTICAGGSDQLTSTTNLVVVTPAACSVNATAACPSFGTIGDEKTVGAGVLVYGYNDGSYPTFGNFGSAYATTHILYRASDLLGAGIVAGRINSLTFDVNQMLNSAGSQVYPEVKIDMGCTASTVMVSYANPAVAFSTVFNPKAYTMSVGKNTFFFDQSYNWDGVQNIVIRVCWRVATGGDASAMTRYAFTNDNSPGYNCVFSGNSNFEAGQCAISAFTSLQSRRPNTTFGFCKPRPITLVYAWTPATGLSSTSIANPIASPTTTTVYTVSVYEAGKIQCVSSANVTVTVNPTPTASAAGVTICSGTATTLTATGGTTYQWFSVAAGGVALVSTASYTTPTLAATTTYYVQTTSGGCTSPRIPVVVTVTAPPATPTAAGVTICAGNTASLSATAPAGATFDWFTAAAGGVTLFTGTPFTTPILNANTTYYVQSSIGTCVQATRKAVVVTVVAAPVAPTAPGKTICAGTSTTLTATAPGGTYNWYAAAVGGASLFTGATYTTPVLNTTTTYYVDATNATPCTGPRAAVVVTVNAVPVAPTAAGVTICSGNTATLTATAPGPVYDWFAASVGGASLFTGVSFTTPVLATTTTYYVQSTQSACTSVRTPVVVTVTPLPTATGTPNPQTICSGTASSVALTSGVAGATFSWPTPTATGGITGGSASSGTTIAQTLTNPGASAGTVTYVVTPNANGCNGPTINVVVNVNPTPVAPTAAGVTICSGNTATLTATAPGGTYNWYAAAVGGASLFTGATYTTPVLNTTTTYYVDATTATPCTGPRTAVVVTVNAVPVAPTAAGVTICSGNTATLTATAPDPVYDWFAASVGGATLFTGTPFTTPSLITTTTYYVQSTQSACTSVRTPVVVTVTPLPTATGTPNPQTICSGTASSVALTSGVGGATFSWPTPTATGGITGGSASSGTTIAQTLTNPSTSAGTVTYVVTPNANGCNGPTINVVVNVNPTPVATATPASQSICTNTATSIALTANIAGTTFAWATPAATGGITGGASGATNSIAQTLVNPGTSSGTVTYSVTPTASGCVGNPISVVITVNPTPNVTATPNPQTICSGTAPSISLTSATAGATFSWPAPTVTGTVTGASASSGGSIAQTLTNTGTSVGTVTYSVTPSANGCTGAPINVVVNVNPIPVASASPETICSGATSNIAITSTIAGTTFAWTASASGTITGSSSGIGTPIAQTLTNTGSSSGTVTYTITPTANGCTGLPITVIETVNPSPVAVATPATKTICSGIDPSIALTSNVAGTTFNWTVATSGAIGGAAAGSGTSIGQTLTNAGTAVQTATYTVTPSAAGCVGTPITVTVTVNPIPNAVAAPVTICSGTATNIPITSGVAGTTFVWTQVSSGVSGASAGAGTPIIQTLTATTASAGTVTYTITPTANGCSGTPITVVVTVNPTPTVTATPSTITICSGTAPSPAIALTSNVAGATFNWAAPVATGGITGGAAGSSTSIADVLTNPSNTLAGTVTYSITPTANGCPGTAINAVVTVNPSPVAPTASAVNYCVGDVSSPLTATGTGLKWYDTDNITVLASAPTPNTASATVLTYYVSQVLNGCEGPKTPVVVTVNAVPAMPTSASPLTYCQGDVIPDLTATGGGGAIKWYSDAALTTLVHTGSPFAAGITNTISYWVVEQSAAGCKSPSKKVDITVNPLDNPTFSYSSGTFCQTGTNPTTSPAQPGGTFTVSPAGLVISATGTINVSASTLGTYTITYTTNGPCPKSSSVTVTITSSPNATFTYSGPYCVGGSPNPLPSYPTGGSPGLFSSVPSLGAALDVNTGEINLSIATAGTYTVTNTIASGGGCATAVDNETVTIKPTPVVTADKMTETICSGGTTNINLSGTPAGVTFSWVVSSISGTVTGSANGTGASIAQTLVNTGSSQATVTYDITPSVVGNSCTSTPISVVISIDPVPATPTVTTPINYCQNDAASALSATITAGATANWFDGSHTSLGSTAPTPSTAVAGTFTYTVSQTINGCTGLEATITVVVNPIPAAPTAVGATYCQGAALSALTATGSGGTFKWYSNAALTMQVGVGASFMPTNTVTATYYVVETKTGCASAATPVVVTIIPKDDATFAYSGATFCLSGTNPTPITIVKPGGTFSASSPVVIDPTTGTVNLAATGLGTSMPITYTTNGACPDTKVVNITITNAPSANFSYPASPYCATGTAIPTIVAPNSPGAFTSTAGLNINPNTGEVDLVTSTAGTYTVTNTIVASGGCAAATGTASITINPAPAPPTVTNLTYCENAVASALTATGSNLLWYPAATGEVGSVTAPTPTTTPVGTTAYYVSQTVAGCEGSRASLLVNINPNPVAPTAPSPAAYCQGAPIAPLTATGSGGTLKWYSDAGLTIQVGTNSPFNSGATTTSSFYVNETNSGCSGPGTRVDITVNPSDNASFAYTSGTFCKTGGANPIPTPVLAGGTYSASPAGLVFVSNTTGEINLASSALGTYTVSYLTNGPCPQTGTTVVNIVSAANPAFTYAAAYCKSSANPLPGFGGGGSAGIFSATPAGLVFVNTSTGEINLAASAIGTYTITNTITGGGCPTVTATATVTINNAPGAPAVTNLNYCKGIIASQLTPNGANNTWYNALVGGAVVTPAPTPSTTTVGNKNYYVSQTAGGCEGPRATLTVTTNPVPVAPTATTPINYCKNDVAAQLTATAVSGGSLSWYTVSTGGAASATAPTPNTAGSSTNFWVSETATGCEGPRFKISVVINSTPVPGTANVVYCQNDVAVPLTATGAGTLKWYDASNVYIGTTVTPSTTTTGVTTYYVTQTLNGCESTPATLTVTVTAPVAPTVTTPVAYCINTTATPLTASITAGGNTLVWYDASMNPLGSAPTPSTATAGTTTYYVSQKTAANCEGPKATITVTVNETAAPVVIDIPYCQNAAAVALTATGTNVLWYTSTTGLGSSTAPTPSTGSAGSITYYATQTANNCESVKAPLVVTINALPNAPTVTPTPICPGNSEILTATAPGGNYTWYDNTATTVVGTGVNYTTPILAATTTFYVETVDPATSCKGPQAQVVVVVNALPNAPTVNNKTICAGDTIGLQVQGLPGETYHWYDAAVAGTLVNTGSTYYLGTPALSVSYYVDANNGVGCTSVTRTKVDLTVNAVPSAPVVSNPPAVCFGDNYPAITANGGGGTFDWYADAALTSHLFTGATYQAGGTVTSNTTFYVRESNGLCNGSSNSVIVSYNPLTVSSVKIDASKTSICQGELITFTAKGTNPGNNPGYAWYVNNIQIVSATSSTYTSTFNNGDVIYCQMTIGSGITCPAQPSVNSNNITITVNPTPSTAATFTATACDPLITDITAKAANMTYKWSFVPGDTIVTTNPNLPMHKFVYTNGLPTTFGLRVSNSQGCYKDTVLSVTVFEKPIANFTFNPDVISNLDPHVYFTDKTSQVVNRWEWNFGDDATSQDQNPTHLYKKDGVYNVTLYVINTSGCSDSLVRKLIVNEEFVFYIPEAFTPNGDGINDTFGGKGLGIESFDLTIFNRWGNEIFHSTDITNQWDGSAFGRIDGAIVDVYTYRFIIVDVHKKKHEYVGKVSLLR